MTITLAHRKLAILLIALAPIPLGSFALASWALVTSHNRAAEQRKDARAATILLARAICAENAVLEDAVMEGVKTADQAERTREFFARFNAPVNAALQKLDAQPCERR